MVDFTRLVAGFIVLIVSLTVHEAAHAWSADRLGDGTARRLGRLSLNPAVHVDPIGTILFPLLAMVTNLPLIGWAKPVPVAVAQLRGNWRQKFMVIAAAGPASNLVLAVAAATVLAALAPVEASGDAIAMSVTARLEYLFRTMVVVNVLLAVFNMVPVPPLDGGNVLSGLLTGPMAAVFDRLRPFGFLILYGLLLTGMLWTLVSPPAELLLSWLL
ncbi:MAG: site-2 protease family protein [Acidobacteria bacterium]|nr:site-2 protease family protein [Acidobacteriota bacterium]